jgi:hypothetical protein
MQTQRFRQFAMHVLIAWLLVLASGVVNACVVQPAMDEPPHAAGHGGHVPDAEALGIDDGHEQESHAGKPPCDRCCDEPSVLAQPVKQQGDSASGFWLAPVRAPYFSIQGATDRLATWLGSGEPPSGASVPIPIAFLRLAL